MGDELVTKPLSIWADEEGAQVETEMRTQASRNGVDRHVVSHQNGRRGVST